MECCHRYVELDNSSLGGLSNADLLSITEPTIVFPGSNELHPPEMAKKLHELIPHLEISVRSESIAAELDRRREVWPAAGRPPSSPDSPGPATWFLGAIAPIVADFLRSTVTGG